MSLKENEITLERELIGKGKTAPRVTSDHVDACIVGATYSRIPNSLGTLCVMALYNGHVLYGVNTGPVSAENFDPAIGERLAFENAREQIWPLEGYLLRDRLHRAEGGAPVPAYGESVADRLAAEKLISLGYGFDIGKLAWLRGDEDLVPGPAPTDAADAALYLSQGLGQRTIMGADYGSEPDRSVAVTADGTVIEQIDGSADIVREPVSADGHSTSEGFTPLTVEQMAYFAGNTTKAPEAPHGRHPDGTPITVVTDEQQAAITAADTFTPLTDEQVASFAGDTTEATEGGQVATGPSEPQG